MTNRMKSAFRFLAFAAALLCVAPLARAQVSVSLSSETGQVGAPLQLQYQFLNVGRPGDMPRTLMVDGLEIRLTGRSQRTEIVNMQATSMMIFAYTVIPNRPGNFTIPGFAVQVDGRQVRTPSVSLRVTGPGKCTPLVRKVDGGASSTVFRGGSGRFNRLRPPGRVRRATPRRGTVRP